MVIGAGSELIGGREVYLALLRVFIDGDSDGGGAAGALGDRRGSGGDVGGMTNADIAGLIAGGGQQHLPLSAGDVRVAAGTTTKAARWARALALLERHYDRIDACEALNSLPGATKISALRPYLFAMLRYKTEVQRKKMVARQLLRVEDVKVKQLSIRAQSRSVTVTDARVCPVCNRPIGNSVILVYPNGTVVHHACGRGDLHTCPATKQRFLHGV